MELWNSRFADAAPLLTPMRDLVRRIDSNDWPDLRSLQQLVDEAGLRVASGLPLQLVAPGGGSAYEIRVYEHGELECRAGNWHDLFNVLVWLTFPRAKAALNARHHAAWLADDRGGRGKVRDALTLFDESGLVVVASDDCLLELIREFRWKDLFWARRAACLSAMRFLLFGHALCEKALQPYRGMTGHALLFPVATEILNMPLAEQLDCIDTLLAVTIADPQAMLNTRQLAPLPVLGVPGWCVDNASPAYYDDTQYFRSGRQRKVADG